MIKRIYILLQVYNYDCSSRYMRIKHICRDEQQAHHIVNRLETLEPGPYGRTHGWLDRNHSVYGFIDKIEGIFEETTRRVA